MLSECLTDYAPPDLYCSNGRSELRFMAHCNFSKLYSYIVHRLYSAGSSSQSTSELEETISNLHHLTTLWKEEVTSNSTTGIKQDRVQIMTLISYHELVLLNHGRMLTVDCSSVSTEAYKNCQRHFLSSACELLDLMSNLGHDSSQVSWLVLNPFYSTIILRSKRDTKIYLGL